ncbi:DnaA N-terminal domain-containing protein [Calidifontibacillus erzurumensis]|uniref:DnaA N-terminal domain-containing protein n=1 Tax=Calidifontibacillus erzurumensis TaxID=2741433 RepID=A0A8J8GH17_9BACI|nr:DnaA N-terminal domain-containing protein [Calidifontibacillus erzurumensis]NSL53249.1 hypothetical protein [Calidifontibacillus erzurumensis]
MEKTNAKKAGTCVLYSIQKGAIDSKELQQLWTKVQNHLENQLSKQSYETWVKPTELLEINHFKRETIIAVPNEFAQDWLQSRYTKIFKEALYNVTNCCFRVIFVERKEAES